MTSLTGEVNFKREYEEDSFISGGVHPCTLPLDPPLDCAPNKLQIMLKEAMHIKWENPTLNKQLKHADLTLSFWYYSLSSTGLFYFYYYYFNFFRTFCFLIIIIISVLQFPS